MTLKNEIKAWYRRYYKPDRLTRIDLDSRATEEAKEFAASGFLIIASHYDSVTGRAVYFRNIPADWCHSPIAIHEAPALATAGGE